MTNDVTSNSALPAKTEEDQIKLLAEVLYPGAKLESVKLVLDYCKVMSLDPMLKPVHIVSIKGKDTLMPGIGAYRTIASRSGSYAGISDPEFGPTISRTFSGKTFHYPDWCRISVKRIVQNVICEFSAKEYWLENYATAYGSDAPNTMWAKRAFGQLAKCAEAQALRKAFPEFIGAVPTHEEMEGKEPRDITPENAPDFIYEIDNASYGPGEVLTIVQNQYNTLFSTELEAWKKKHAKALSKWIKENPGLKSELSKLKPKNDSVIDLEAVIQA